MQVHGSWRDAGAPGLPRTGGHGGLCAACCGESSWSLCVRTLLSSLGICAQAEAHCHITAVDCRSCAVWLSQFAGRYSGRLRTPCAHLGSDLVMACTRALERYRSEAEGGAGLAVGVYRVRVVIAVIRVKSLGVNMHHMPGAAADAGRKHAVAVSMSTPQSRSACSREACRENKVPAKVRSVRTGVARSFFLQESRLGVRSVKAMHLRRSTTIIDRGWCGSPILCRPTYITATPAAAPHMQQAQLAATWRSDDVERFLTDGRDWKVMLMALALHMQCCQPPPAKSFKPMA